PSVLVVGSLFLLYPSLLLHLYSFPTRRSSDLECKINGSSVLHLALALLTVLITQDTSNVFESVQAMIFLEYKSIILVRETNPFIDRKSTRLNSSHVSILYAVFCFKKKT